MANHNMKDSIKEVVEYISDNIKLPEIDTSTIDTKIAAHADQLVIDTGGVHGFMIDNSGAKPVLKFQKSNGTWETVSIGGDDITFTDQDIADIKAAFDRGLQGSNNSNP